MKTTWKIAKAELYNLFCSPIAWLILIIFAFQAGLTFSDLIDDQLRYLALGYRPYNLTSRLLLGFGGVFAAMQDNLYLYIPLLTMGLMSKEYRSGSIKLLYSSPVTNTQIILGKYLSMLVYALLLIAVLLLFLVFCALTVEHFDYPFAFTGLLGILLLTCAYAAIGLFMSTLTAYQVVAAVGTLTLLALLNYIGNVGQDIAFVRDITYWLSLSGRSDSLIEGMICSQDVLYFFIVIVLFLVLSILKLKFARTSVKPAVKWMQYTLTVCVALLVGYTTTRPKLMGYYDATATKANTLTPESQEVMKQLTGGLTITTYVNLLDENYGKGMPSRLNYDREQFEKYIRFKPELEMNYVYYYDRVNNPSIYAQFPGLDEEGIARRMCDIMDLDFDMFLSPEEIHRIIDLTPEGNRFVRVLERENGARSFLRVYDDNQRDPRESEITAALKRLVVKAPKVGFVAGHGERSIDKAGERDYAAFARNLTFRYSLINQGFDAVGLNLADSTGIPADIDIVVIAEARTPFTDGELARLHDYVERGGNLIIAGEPRRQEVMNPLVEPFGVRFLPGIVVHPTAEYAADLLAQELTPEAAALNDVYAGLRRNDYRIIMPGAVGLAWADTTAFHVTPMLTTPAQGSWMELQTTDFVDDKAVLDTLTGEREAAVPTMLRLTRQVGDKEQRILILGDADCMSNGELTTERYALNGSNFSLITESFRDLSYNVFPINTDRPRPADDAMSIGQGALIWVRILFMGLVPAALIVCYTLTWWRRRKK